MFRKLFLTSVLVAFHTFSANAACDQNRFFQTADRIVLGKVISSEPFDAFQFKLKIKVSQSWKSDSLDRLTIISSRDLAFESLARPEKTTILIYLNWEEGQLNLKDFEFYSLKHLPKDYCGEDRFVNNRAFSYSKCPIPKGRSIFNSHERPINRIALTIPPAAKALQIRQIVTVVVWFDHFGRVVEACVPRAHPLLRKHSIEIAKKFVYARFEGKGLRTAAVRFNYGFSVQRSTGKGMKVKRINIG